MSIPKCHPNVYRDAAKLVDSGKYVYSCLAVSSRFNDSDLNKKWFYRDQYEAMFGPHEKFSLEVGGSSFIMGDEENEVRHPFWNQEPTEQNKEYRVMALLFMAAICENP